MLSGVWGERGASAPCLVDGARCPGQGADASPLARTSPIVGPISDRGQGAAARRSTRIGTPSAGAVNQ